MANTTKKIAAVDLGSNSFHLIVGRIEDGHLTIIDKMREMVRLAAGLDENSQLDEASQQRALECLARFGQRLSGMPVDNVRIVGTNTLRKARACKSFREASRQAIGHDIDIISGQEEARLIYLGVSHSLPEQEGRRLVVDIGGGSTELIIGERFEPQSMESLYMGCVSFSRRFFPDGLIEPSAFQRALMAARLELRPHVETFKGMGWQEVIGASGTIRAIGACQRELLEQENRIITLEGMQQIRDALIKAGHMDKVKLPGIKDERKPVLPGGLAVLMAVFEALQIEHMRVSDWALREGLLYDLVGRIRHEDVRERTIEVMSRRYHADIEQARRVQNIAHLLLEQVAVFWDLEDEEAEHLLRWAAHLHEIGLSISHSQYHKHGHYLLANSDLPGFSQQEQRNLALLVRGHRRKLPYTDLDSLAEEQRVRLCRLLVLLRLAVLFCRSRKATTVPVMQVIVEGPGLHLNLQEAWLAAHPLTLADLQQEQGRIKLEEVQLKVSVVAREGNEA